MRAADLLITLALVAPAGVAHAKGPSCADQAEILANQWMNGYEEGLADRARALLLECPSETAAHRVYQMVSVFSAGEGSRIVAEYRDALARSEGSPEAVELLAAALLLGRGAFDEEARAEATSLLEPLNAAGTVSADGLLLLARLAAHSERSADEVALVERAYGVDPTKAAGPWLRMLMKQGRVADAFDVCADALNRKAPDPRPCGGLWGDTSYTPAETERLMGLDKKIRKLMPRKAKAGNELDVWRVMAFYHGVDAEAYGEDSKAQEEEARALIAALHPELTPPAAARDDRAAFYDAFRDIRQTVDMAERIRKFEALLDGAEGDLATAVSFALYQAYMSPLVNDKAAADRVLRRLVEADPTQWGLYLDVGEALIEGGELDALEALITRGFETLGAAPMTVEPMAPGDPGKEWLSGQWGALADLYHLRGRLRLAQGQVDAAVLDLLTAWRAQFIGFDGAKAYRSDIALHLAEAYEAGGRKQEAFEAWLLAAAGEGDSAAAAKEHLAPLVKARYPNWQSVDAFVAAVGPAQAVDPQGGAPVVGDAPHGVEGGAPHPLVDQPLPDLNLTSLSGEAFSLSGLKGKVVFLTFWATWCGPCMDEMPVVARLKESWGDSVEVVALATWDQEDKVRAFVEANKLPFRFAMAPGDASSVFDFTGIPFACVIDPQGTIRFVHLGYGDDTMDHIAEQVRSLQ